MNENEELEQIEQEETQEELQELTDEQAAEQLYSEPEEEDEEVNVLGEEAAEAAEEAAEDEGSGEGAQEQEEDAAHRARDEPSADELFARKVREAYGDMTDEQIVDAMLTAKAERMHAEDPEISVKAAKMILEARTQTGGEAKSEEKTDAHAQMLTEQAKEMAGTKEGAELLREMLGDETVKAKIDAGEWDVKQARAYYEGKRESAAQAKKAPTTMKTRSAQTVKRKSIDEMSDAEFAQIEARVNDALRQGKRVKF